MLKKIFVVFIAQFLFYVNVFANNISGEQMYSAIFFHNGPLYSHLQDVVPQKNSKIGDADSSAQSNIISQIKQSEPDFFHKFNTEMTSGHPERVRTMYDAAMNKTLAAFPINTAANVSGLNPSAACVTMITNVALAMIAVVAVTIVVKAKQTEKPLDIESSPLAKDLAMVKLAKALNYQPYVASL